MRVIQLSVKAWLVLDAQTKPRTGETHVVHRVERWNHIPEQRASLRKTWA